MAQLAPTPPRSISTSTSSHDLDGRRLCQLPADSVEKVASAAACRSSVPAVEVAASHFKLSSGVSLSVLAQVWGLI